MKLFSTALAFAAALPLVSGLRKGFNIAAERPAGGCKSEADWAYSFQAMKKLPGGFNQARLYASSDCNTLVNAVPAAQRNGIKLLVGVWTEDDAHFGREKAALLKAAKTHGVGWISAISVGSEDLYRGDTSASALAQKIYDVRGMMSTVGGKGIPVGHVDTWTAFVNDGNAAVIKACDFIGFDGYPYFQNASIANANAVFQRSITATRAAIARHKPGTPLWITETGWPVAGPNYGPAHPSKVNARSFWKGVMCPRFKTYNFFVYTLRDYQAAPANPSFGVIGPGFQPLFDLRC